VATEVIVSSSEPRGESVETCCNSDGR